MAAAAPRLPCPRAARGTAWGHSEALCGNPRIAVRRDGKALQRRALEGVVVCVEQQISFLKHGARQRASVTGLLS